MTRSFQDSLKNGSLSPEMVVLSGGTFVMGQDGSCVLPESPAHKVTVEEFAMGKYPVTFDEYDAFCEATGAEKPDDNGWGRGKRPVINISWDDAQRYMEWLSEQTGEEYRLPTEAEWEYAARAGLTENAVLNFAQAWCFENSGLKTHPVGEKKPNAFGLYDMLGNVWEWCQDFYKKYPQK